MGGPPPPTNYPPYPPYPPAPPRRRRGLWAGLGALAAVLAIATIGAIATSGGGTTTVTTSPASTLPATAAPTTGAAQVAIGEVATISEGGQPLAEVTVAAVETPASLVGGALTPTGGAVFTTINITVRNPTGGPRDYNLFDFYLRGPDGARHQPTFGREPALNSGTLNPGETVSGWVTWDAGLPHGTLVYTAGGLGTGPALAEWAF